MYASSYARPRPRIKLSRRTPRPAEPFGCGILASKPYAGRMPFTAADLAWLDQRASDEDRRLDFAAGEAMALARYEMGIAF